MEKCRLAQKYKRVFAFAMMVAVIIALSNIISYADTPRYKRVTKTVVDSVDSFESSIFYNEGGYYGNLGKSGSSRRFIMIPADGKYIENEAVNTGESEPSSTYYYSKDGYSGTLNLIRTENNPHQEDKGHFESVTQTFERTADNTSTVLYDAGGNEISTTYSWDNTNNHPTYHIDEDGFVGDIAKDPNRPAECIFGPERTDNPDGTYTIVRTWRAYYEGDLTKEVWIPNIQLVNDYTGYYSGNTTKPAVYAYEQTYVGSVRRGELIEENYGVGSNTTIEGDPVNISTGSFYTTETDLNIADRGLPLEIKRYYSSVDNRTSMLGKSWRMNYDTNISVDSTTNGVSITYPDGHAVLFASVVGSNQYIAPEHIFDVLIKNADNTYSLKLRDKTNYLYSSDGKLISITDKNNNSVTLQYSTGGDLNTVTSASGKQLTFVYENGLIKTITDPAGRTIVYTYNNGNLWSVKGIGGGTITYNYDANGITYIIDENGKKYIENEYDQWSRVIRQKDEEANVTEYSYDDANLENTCTYLATGRSIKYTYNDLFYITKKTYKDGTYDEYNYDQWGNRNSVKDRNENITLYTYNQKGNILSETSPAPFNYTTGYTYDNNDNLQLITRQDGGTTEFQYNTNENLIKKIDKIDSTLSSIKTYSYDGYGRLNTITDAENNTITLEYGASLTNNPQKMIDGEGNETTFGYDDLNRRTTITTIYGTTTYSYNNKDKVEKITDPLGNITRMKYDSRGNLIKIIKPEQYSEATDDGSGYTYQYDAMDRLIKEINPLGYVKAVKYDSDGNKIKEINPNYYNSSTNDGIGMSYDYDADGRIIKVTNPSGQQARNKYDATGNIIKAIDANNYDESTDDGPGMEYTYDVLNRLVQIKDSFGNIVKKLVYDSQGRITKEIDAKGYLSGSDDAARYGTLYKYNYLGWLMEERKPVKEESGTIYYRVTQYTYDMNGKIVEERKTPEYVTAEGEPANWHTIAYTYDGNGRVKTISDTGRAYMEYGYDVLGNTTLQKTKINDNVLQTTKYHFDASGRLDKKWTEVNGSDLADSADGVVNVETLYEYDKSGNMKKIVSPEGYVTELAYDAAGQLTEKTEHVNKSNIDIKGAGIKVTSPRNTVYPGQQYEYKVEMVPDTEIISFSTQLNYDARVFEVVYASTDIPGINIDSSTIGNISIGSANANITSSKVVATVTMKLKDNISGMGYIGISPTSTYTDETGKTYKFTELTGKTHLASVPDMNNDTKVETNDFTLTAIVKGIDINNIMYDDKFDIDNSGVIDIPDLDYIKDWLFTNKSDQISKISTEKFCQKQTNSVYDSGTEQATRITGYEYDKAGNLVKEKDCNNDFITYTYDEYNRLISVEDKEHNKSRVFYDEAGNIVKEVLPENYNSSTNDGPGTTYKYDSMNRVVEIGDANNSITRRNVYDISGLVTKVIDGKGYASASTDDERYGVEYVYDIGNRVTSITTPASKQKGKTSVEYTYNALDYVVSYTDGESHTTAYERNIWGNATSIKDAKDITTYYEYDYAGNLTKTTDGNQKATVYEYNSMNLLKYITDPLGQTITYKYDKEGRVAEEVDRNGKTLSYSYNLDDNLTEKSNLDTNETDSFLYNKDGSLLAAINANGINSYEYTPNGYVKKKLRNGKVELAYTYDKNGNITGVTDITGKTTEYTYDSLGRLDTVLDEGNQVADYEFNVDGTIRFLAYNNGININYDYDLDKNMTSLVSNNAQGGTLNSFGYTYDNNGNQLTKIENGQTTTYTYDELNRLKTALYPVFGLETYTYDNAGNRKSKVLGSKTTTYDYDGNNRLTQSIESGIITTYSYDNNGNLLEESVNGAKTLYTYSGFNKLTETVKPDGKWLHNEYSAEGLRVSTEENGFRYDFVFDRGNVITELNANTQQVTRSIRGIGLIGQKDSKGNLNYYLNNAHGDVVSLVDAAGQVLNSYQYDAFGNTTNYAEKVANRFMYAGEQFDKITGQYYLRARYYNPVAGRFTQEDTYRGDGLNLYTYVANNPLKYVDPSGHYYIVIQKDGSYKVVVESVLSAAISEGVSWFPYGSNVVGMVENMFGVVGGNSSVNSETELMKNATQEVLDAIKPLKKLLNAYNVLSTANGAMESLNIAYIDKIAIQLLKQNNISLKSKDKCKLEQVMDRASDFIAGLDQYFVNNILGNFTTYEIDSSLHNGNKSKDWFVKEYKANLIGVLGMKFDSHEFRNRVYEFEAYLNHSSEHINMLNKSFVKYVMNP